MQEEAYNSSLIIPMTTLTHQKAIHKKDIFNLIKDVPQKPYFEDTKHNVILFKWDCFDILPNLPENSIDMIFADPPYDLQGIATIPELIFQNSLLNEGGCLIVEHSDSISFQEHPRFKEKREYGSVNFSFFQ